MKEKSVFVCTNCGYESPKWIGKCNDCGEWNTLEEKQVIIGKQKGIDAFGSIANALSEETKEVISLAEVADEKTERYLTSEAELDRVLGGGLVKGSLVLIGGEPGIGKSTLLLQVADKIASKYECIYIAAEESPSQIAIRAKRLGLDLEKIKVIAEPNIENSLKKASELKPKIIILDSIQTVYTTSIEAITGSVSQIREVSGLCMRYAKTTGTTFIIIGHVTKEGGLAGPKILEHIVDAVVMFEGEHTLSYRILRSVKNRFGSTNEIGVFEMRSEGLVSVTNPSQMFISSKVENYPGTSITCLIEGIRPILVEIQALIGDSFNGGNPRRVCVGIDNARVSLLAAVLERKLGLKLSIYDLYLNVVGGLKVDDTVSDLSICASLLTALSNKNPRAKGVYLGEVGLTGEVRGIPFLERRIDEAKRLGFKYIVAPIKIEGVQEIKHITELPNYL